jgi:REP element-mobilizing transposase RayT
MLDLVMGEAFQIRDREMPYFLAFQVVGWVDVFTGKVYGDLVLENLAYCRKEKGLCLFGYVLMGNHLHLAVQQKDGKLSDRVRLYGNTSCLQGSGGISGFGPSERSTPVMPSLRLGIPNFESLTKNMNPF